MNESSKIPEIPAVGENLRRERRRQQLSLEELAAASGVSKAMLSQIESGKVNPTIATMWKISHALRIEFETLIHGEAKRARKFEVNRADSVASIQTDGGTVCFRVYSSLSMAEDLELYRMELAPGGVHTSQGHTAGTEEFLTILAGKVEVSAGENRTELNAGAIWNTRSPTGRMSLRNSTWWFAFRKAGTASAGEGIPSPTDADRAEARADQPRAARIRSR